MYQEPLGLPSTDPTAHHLGWLAYLALAAMIGVAMGNLLGTPTLWLTFCFMLLGVGAFCICKRKATPICRVLLLMAAAAGFANWYQVHHQYLRADDVRQYASGQSQLIQLTGTIISPIHLSSPRRGALGQFSYQSPATLFVIATDTITRHGIPHQASGNVLVKVQQIDPGLNTGNRIQCTGWFRKTQGPSNPGEYDYRQMLAGQDIFTRLTLPGVGTLKRFETQGGWNSIRRFRAWCAAHAVNALSIGMDPNSRELGLLQIMLLGQRGGNLDGLDQAFRSVGLAHLLSISGAHLGILLFLTLISATIFTQYPHRAVWVVVIVLTFYMIVVPTRVPIARAGVMAAAFCFCSLTGLTIGRINILGLAVLFVLIWRPADLFTPGFQLSFGTVAGLIAFVPNVSRFLWPDPQVQLIEHFRHRIGRRIADYIAVNFVAFSIALPMVAYHYQMLSPWNMILTMLALPIVTLMLGFGFLKIMLGMFFPSMALLLNGLTTLATQTLSSLVENGTTWTFASIGLGAGPTVWWMLGTLMVISALFTGMFAYRRRTLLACLTICILWLVIPMLPTVGLNKIFPPAASSPVAQLHAISVGNGSCYLLRLRPNQRFKRDLVILFDCGSHQFMDLGKRTVVPVLENLNIRQIDYLMLSHADIDHYSGTLDVADAITIKQVLLPVHMLEDAQQNPRKATARLLDGLEQRQIPIQVVAAGWQYQFGNHNLKLIWPPPAPEVFSGVALDTVMDIATFETIKDNDSSLVLSVKTSGRRILLTGDIQQRAMTTMLARKMDLSADIIDLPHHGSIVPSTAKWLMAVGPKIAIQSASWSRLYQDKWPALLKPLNLPMQRLVTAKRGMITVQISKNGTITTTDFLSDR